MGAKLKSSHIVFGKLHQVTYRQCSGHSVLMTSLAAASVAVREQTGTEVVGREGLTRLVSGGRRRVNAFSEWLHLNGHLRCLCFKSHRVISEDMADLSLHVA